MDLAHRIDDIISDSYDGIIDPSKQTIALRKLANLYGSEHVALTSLHKQHKTTNVIQSSGLSDQSTIAFQKYYYLLDPSRAFLYQFVPGEWYVDYEQIGKKGMARSEFYQDFMKSNDFGALSVAPIWSNQNVDCFLALQYKNIDRSEKSNDSRNIKSLLPHLQRSLQLQSHFESLKLDKQLLASSLHASSLGMVIVCENRIVHFINQAAESILRRRHEIKITGNKLEVPSSSSNKVVNAINAACGIKGPRVSSGLKLGLNNQLNLHLIVTPLPSIFHPHHYLSKNFALIVAQDLSIPMHTKEFLLTQMYGLSVAEARVACALLKGSTPKQIAIDAGVAISTIRSQLKAIFSKTGTAKQTELMQILYPILSIQA
jgi:DNA-binding CsgD family transcriptional regulator